MKWAIDVGNTHYKIGVIEDDKITKVYRFRTIRDQSIDEYYFQFKNVCREMNTDVIPPIWVASVVPSVSIALEMLAKNKSLELHFIDTNSPLSFSVDSGIARIGADILVLAEAAVQLEGKNVIIVSAGTATTVFAVVNGVLIGGAIAPGIKGSVESLIQSAALLNIVYLELPEKVVAQTTETAMCSGILYGFAGLVDGLVKRMKSEIKNSEIKVVASGGLISKIESISETIDRVYPDLGLQGISYVALK